MKVAFYYRSVNGGIRTHVEALSMKLREMGVEVKLINQYALGSFMLGNSSGGISYGFDISLGKIRKEVEDCDILHIHHAATFSEFLLPFSSICSECSIINTFHIPVGNNFGGEFAKALIGTLASLYEGRSKKFISVSSKIAEDIQRYCFETETVVIPNGVDINRFHPRTRAGAGAGAGAGIVKRRRGIYIGYLGRLSPEKNIINMIKAVKRLMYDSTPVPVYLKIAGTGPLYERIKRQENERIKVLGYVDDAASFYRSLDIFVLPSKLEAQPIALLEAMASGLPVIATDVGDNGYYVHGNGILCGTTVNEIRDAIVEMLHSDLEKMGEESRQIVERGYSWDRIAARTLDVYRSINKA